MQTLAKVEDERILGENEYEAIARYHLKEPPLYLYDELKEEGFRNLMVAISLKMSQAKDVYPGPMKGKDGGVDNQIKGFEKKIIEQFKFRELCRAGNPNQQSPIVSEFEKFIENLSTKKDVRLRFYTNVSFTKKTIQKIGEVVEKYPDLDIEYGDFNKITDLLRQFPDVYLNHFPQYARRRTRELAEENEDLKKIVESQEFVGFKDKFNKLFISLDLKKQYYYPMVYLLQPVYIAGEKTVGRGLLANLFNLTEPEQSKIEEVLLSEKALIRTGDILSIVDSKKAKEELNELINNLGADLEEFINLLIGEES